MRRRALLAVLPLAVALAGGCESMPEAAGPCPTVVWHKPASTESYVEIIGDFQGWKRPGVRMEASRADGWRAVPLELPAGLTKYAILEDGVWLRDSAIGTSAFRDGHEVTLRDVSDCRLPALRVAGVGDEAAGSYVDVAYEAGAGGAPLDPSTLTAVDDTDAPVPLAVENPATATRGLLRLRVPTLAAPRPRLRIRGKDREGSEFPEIVATLWGEGQRDWRPSDSLVYQIVVDRFRGSDGRPLAAPASAGGRANGTLKGVTSAIEDGTFSHLGVGAIWLSPLYQNPEGTFLGAKDGRSYTGYHGYWPAGPRALDPHLGTEDDLRTLMRSAHRRGLRVLFDVVPNHVHAESPYATKSGWTTGKPDSCTCGVGSCDWATHTQDCWFTNYLPNLDWSNDDLAKQQTEDIRWWVETFGADGIRIDAIPMMPRAANRRIAYDLRKRFEHPGEKLWIVGENFTGPGSYSQLAYHLGPAGLDGEFHFPLLWALRSAVAAGSGPMAAIDDALVTGEKAWGEAAPTMGLIAGNHDVARFATVANGDSVTEGWTPAPTPTDPLVFTKQSLALGLVATLPGAPFLYYGDEVALPGREDPDARRVMPAEEMLSGPARDLRERFAALARFRACAPALRRGTYRALYADSERLIFAREISGSPLETVLVVATRNVVPPGTPGPAQERLDIPLPGLQAGPWVGLFGEDTVALSADLTTFRTTSWSLHLYAPRDSSLSKVCPR